VAKLTIDGREVEVPSNASILEAARKLDVNIPTYCWDPRMKPFGACRLCMVEANGRLVASCCTTVRDGMSVLTATPDCLKSRREMVAYLLVHHPLDCPYCDKSGDCELQQRTYEMGIGEVPVRDEKVVVPVDFHHPVVEPFLTRCIVCGKCVRVCDEIRGEGAIEMVNRGFETVVDTAFGQPLECTSCGECIEICPVGALTSKVFKFHNRAWQMQKTHTTCNYCSVGCTMDLEHFKGQVRRVRAHPGYGLNDGFLCALGRFGYDFINHPDRLTAPMVRRDAGLEPASWEEALEVAADRLAQIARRNSQAIGVIGSRRISNEDAFVLQKFAREGLGTSNVDQAGRLDDWPALKALLDAGIEPVHDLNANLAKAEVIVVVGDASQAADIASVKMQNASRYGGATLIVINPYRTQLSKWKTIDLRVAPGQEASALAALAAVVAGLPRPAPTPAEGDTAPAAPAVEGTLPPAGTGHGLSEAAILQAAEALNGAQTVLFALCSGHWLRGRAGNVAAALANLAIARGRLSGLGNGLVFLPEKNNSMGSIDAGLLTDMLPGRRPAPRSGLAFGDLLRGDQGLEALYVVGENLDDTLPEVPFLIVQDILLSETVRRADVVFPASSYAERQGTFTNFEDRAQWFNRAIPPVGQSRPDWQITAELGRRVGQKLGHDTASFAYTSAAQVTREFEAVSGHVPAGAPPATVSPSANAVLPVLATAIHQARAATAPPSKPTAPGDSRFTGQVIGGLEAPEREGAATLRYQPVQAAPAVATDAEHPLLLVAAPQRWVSGSTSRFAAGLLGLYPEALIVLGTEDADRLGLAEGDAVRVTSAAGGVLMRVEVDTGVPGGLVLVPGYAQPGLAVSEGAAAPRVLGDGSGPVAVGIEKRDARTLGFAGFNAEPALA